MDQGHISKQRQLDLKNQELFVLIEVEEIKYLLEVSLHLVNGG